MNTGISFPDNYDNVLKDIIKSGAWTREQILDKLQEKFPEIPRGILNWTFL